MTAATARDITAAGVLGERNVTSVTRQIVALTVSGDLRPHIDGQLVRGCYRLMLNGHGRDALFGAVYISARNGKVVRASLTHGNRGTEERFSKVADIRRVLKSWVAITSYERNER